MFRKLEPNKWDSYVEPDVAMLLKQKGFVGNGDMGCRSGIYCYENNKWHLVYGDVDNSELLENECLRPTQQAAQTFGGDDKNLPNGNCKANHNIVVSMCDWCERFEDKNEPITFTKWLEENKKYGILPPPMELEQFEKFLIQYLFDKEPQIVMPVSEKQARTEILFDILSMYSSKFKKEWNNYLKVKNEKQL